MTQKIEKEKYFESVGRRKSSVARARLVPAGKWSIKVNGKSLEEYFPVREHREAASAPIAGLDAGQKFEISIFLKGGGISSQADAARLATARCLVLHNGDLRKGLKKEGHLKRDPRVKERRKFGLKKARKAPQWSKR